MSNKPRLFLLLLLLLLNLVNASVITARANSLLPSADHTTKIDPLFYFTGSTNAPRPLTQGERLYCTVHTFNPSGQVEMFCRPASPRKPTEETR